MAEVVAARNVVKEYQRGATRVRALSGLSFSAAEGEFIAIVGPSGSGKSTLLHLLGCLDVPTSGSVVIEGGDTAEMSDDEITAFRRRRLGFVFQFFNLVPSLSAWENVALPKVLDGMSLRRMRPAAEELLVRVGLEGKFTHRPAQLSGGELQRVAVARALANDPILLLADEPTGNLDSVTGAQILGLLRDCCETGTAVVLVTHDQQAAGVADRIVEIRDGRVVSEVQPPREYRFRGASATALPSVSDRA